MFVFVGISMVMFVEMLIILLEVVMLMMLLRLMMMDKLVGNVCFVVI